MYGWEREEARDAQAVAEHVAYHIHCAHQRVLGQDRRVLNTPMPADISSNPLTEFT